MMKQDQTSPAVQPSGTCLLAESTDAARIARRSSDELFDGAQEVVILHCGREYRLRITRNGKLILTA